MTVSFLHCSDLHLGFHQFHRDERFDDFGRAFAQVVDGALARDVDFVLVAGDLFNKRSINSRTLSQVMEQLRRLCDASIDTIAVEGNHDKAPYGEGDSWMRFLNTQGFLKLLVPQFDEGRLVLKPWHSASDVGSVLESSSLRVVGLPYQGVMAARRIGELAETLPPAPVPTVLLLHSAVDRLMHLGGVSYSVLEPLRDRVQYVAMGHVHTRYELDDWVYNPGAPECWDLAEAKGEKGFYHVTITDGHCLADFVPSLRRPVLRRTIDIAGCRSADEVYELCRQNLTGSDVGDSCRPLVSLVLAGASYFNPFLVDRDAVEAIVREAVDCLHVEVHNQGLLESDAAVGKAEALSNREHLEQQVLAELFRQEGVSEPASVAKLVDLAGYLKELLQTEFDEEALADAVENTAGLLAANSDDEQE